MATSSFDKTFVIQTKKEAESFLSMIDEPIKQMERPSNLRDKEDISDERLKEMIANTLDAEETETEMD